MHKEDFRPDFWYLYGFFGLKMRMENFVFPDNEFPYSDFWVLYEFLSTKIGTDIKYYKLRSSTHHMFS